MSKICNNCGATIADESRFCILCGTLVAEPLQESTDSCPNASICRQCGKELKEGAKFCAECGTLVEGPSQENTSLSADANICRQCGKELKEGVKFCAECHASIEENLEGITISCQDDQVSAVPDEPQQILESSTDEIKKSDDELNEQAEVSLLTSSEHPAETAFTPITPPPSPSSAPKAKKIYLAILGAVAVAFVFIYLNVGILVIPPSEMIPEGISVVYWRNGTKHPFISSPKRMLLDEYGVGVEEVDLFTTIALLEKIADLVKEDEIIRFPYNDWLYSKSLRGIKSNGVSLSQVQEAEPTEEPVAPAEEEAEETSAESLTEEIKAETSENEGQTLAGEASTPDGQIKGTNVNMREYPSMTAQVVFRFPGWEYVTIHEVTEPGQGKSPWYKVSYKNKTGWVYGEFITEAP